MSPGLALNTSGPSYPWLATHVLRPTDGATGVQLARLVSRSCLCFSENTSEPALPASFLVKR